MTSIISVIDRSPNTVSLWTPMVPMAHFPALLGHRRAAAPPGQLMPACVVVVSGAEDTDDIHLRFSNNAGKPALYKC